MPEILLILVVASSMWVYLDARSIGVRKGLIAGFLNMGPGAWFFSCLLFWIVGFPAYLAKRTEYKRVAHKAAGDELDRLERLSRLQQQGALTEEEFKAKKHELLSRM